MPATRLTHVAADGLSVDTAQTDGMRRTAAISGAETGAEGIWMGLTLVAPRTRSAAHHHGHSETGIYVVAGTPVFFYRDDDGIVALQTGPGDFVHVPPHAVHVEENAGDTEAVVVIARTTQEAIVDNVGEL